MAIPDLNFERGLNTETLSRVSKLSELREKGLNVTLTARMVGPYTDEIRLSYPDGLEKSEFIEDAS